MRYFAVVHAHEWGSTCFMVRCEADLVEQLATAGDFDESHAEFINKALDINFEPDRDETINIFEMVITPETLNNLPLISLDLNTQ